MHKLIIAICLTVFLIGCKGDQTATTDTTTGKTTTINTPIKVADNTKPKVDMPPAGVTSRQNPGMAPLGSITNPYMKGAIPKSTQPRMGAGQPGANVAQPGGIVVQPNGQPSVQPPARKPEPPQNAQGIWHFICNDGCKGGSGKAEACATCGKMLVHNQAYHQ